MVLHCVIAGTLALVPCLSAAFDLQGHRGTRGLAPENTLAAFRQALAIGVDTLETDLAVTKDGVLVIAHDRRLNPDVVRGPDGKWLASPGPPIHALTLAELRTYDVGRLNPASKYAAGFPEQRPADGERFPTFAEVIALAKGAGKPVRLNVETKLDPSTPSETVAPVEFARLVTTAIRDSGMASRITIQSFDWRTLVEAKRIAPEIATVCLTIETASNNNVKPVGHAASPWTAGLDRRNYGGSVPRMVEAAGCSAWSPFWRDATAGRIAEAHALKLTVIPWTVNDPADIAGVIDAGADGVITDYPDRARKVMAAKGMALP